MFADIIVLDLHKHLDQIDDPDALVFTSPNGAPLRHSNSYRRVWMPALRPLGLLGLHLQDLRHTGNQLASDAGASLREMMARLEHDSTRAALIYQHSTTERQRAIADQVSYATAGRNAEIGWKALSKRIGHADVAFTMKQYVQTDLEADREVANTLADLIIGGLLVTDVDDQTDAPDRADET